jgi:hypothetical protein
MYYQKKTLDRAFFVATETVKATKTTTWVASLDLKEVSIVDLRTRQRIGASPSGEPILINVVQLRANRAFERDCDARGNPELKTEEWEALGIR